MASVETAKVVADGVQIVEDWLLFVPERDNVFAHVQALHRVEDLAVDLLLLAYLGVGQVEEAAASTLSGLETSQLQNQHLWRFVDLQLLVDVAVLLASAAVPAVVAGQRFFLAVVFEAVLEIKVSLGVVYFIFFLLEFDVLRSKVQKLWSVNISENDGQNEFALMLHLGDDLLNRDFAGAFKSVRIDVVKFETAILFARSMLGATELALGLLLHSVLLADDRKVLSDEDLDRVVDFIVVLFVFGVETKVQLLRVDVLIALQ